MARARYTVVRKIADGGMAEIYLGTQRGAEGFERPIVIKRIRAALSVDPKFRNMLIDEAHIAMSLVHSNVVQVLDLGTARGSDFLVLELVDGWDLHQLLVRSNAHGVPLPPELALYVSIEVCRALGYAHTRRRDGKLLGIVHRDVSPNNVLVSSEGEVKLTDFGIATALNKREQTLAGTVKGKLGFMSPEQARGEALDHRSDLFSMGTTLYLMMTGRKPYVAPTDLEVLLRMQQCDFPPPEAVKPDLAPEVAAIVRRSMQKEPQDRYASAEEMLLDLERVQRTIFKPVSQTELKRWLAALSERDGSLPTSLRPPKTPPKADKGDLKEGSAIELQEVEPDALLASGGPQSAAAQPALPPPLPATAAPTVPATPEALVVPPPVPAPAPSSNPAFPPIPTGLHTSPTYIEEPEPPVRRGLFGPVTIGVLGVALAGLAWWLRPVAPALVGMAQPRDLVAVVERPDAAAPAPAADAAAVEGPDASAPQGEADAGEPPDAATAAGVVEPAAADAGAAASADDGADENPGVVSVRFVTNPPGAAVTVFKQTYGVTPINVRFKAELMYEVTFQKPGFAPMVKRIHVARRKGQVFSYPLERKKWWQF